ncbi:hypothetical protein QR685DRAFT_44655 [Neurospora intermedia]|uniref:Questionable protein n=1 Tax=Neurospora intermedia TaxID=5142 RepID=A0ABR3DRU0_NEUIN
MPLAARYGRWRPSWPKLPFQPFNSQVPLCHTQIAPSCWLPTLRISMFHFCRAANPTRQSSTKLYPAHARQKQPVDAHLSFSSYGSVARDLRPLPFIQRHLITTDGKEHPEVSPYNSRAYFLVSLAAINPPPSSGKCASKSYPPHHSLLCDDIRPIDDHLAHPCPWRREDGQPHIDWSPVTWLPREPYGNPPGPAPENASKPVVLKSSQGPWIEFLCSSNSVS